MKTVRVPAFSPRAVPGRQFVKQPSSALCEALSVMFFVLSVCLALLLGAFAQQSLAKG